MIIEGLMTTRNADGSMNLAPMGPIVDEQLSSFLFRPYNSSRTFANLQRERQGVFHVIDDVLLFAQAITDTLPRQPETFSAQVIQGKVLSAACRWYELAVTQIDDRQPRTEIQTQILHIGHLRDFFGFNRAKHAVIEAAILASRRGLLPHEELLQQFAALRTPVEKTAGPREREAFALLETFVRQTG